MPKQIYALVGVLGILAVVATHGCKSSESTTPPTSVKDDPSFATDIQPVFTGSCSATSCHGSGASGGLILLQSQSYKNIVNVTSSEDASKKRVLPGDATNSYLIMKLEGRQTSGSRMPVGGSLDTNTIQNIKNWINKGAKDN